MTLGIEILEDAVSNKEKKTLTWWKNLVPQYFRILTQVEEVESAYPTCFQLNHCSTLSKEGVKSLRNTCV